MRKTADGEKASMRTFASSAMLLLGALAVLNGLKSRWVYAAAFGVVASLLWMLRQWAPQVLSVPSRLWWTGLRGLGWINGRLLLTVIFYGVLTPLGILMRCCGWDPLARRASAGSGWRPYAVRQRNLRHYERLY